MSNRSVVSLAFFLVLQIVAFLLLINHKNEGFNFGKQKFVFDFLIPQIEEIFIEGEDTQLQFTKKNGSWQFEEYPAVAVDLIKINKFVEKISSLKRKLSISRTDKAHERFALKQNEAKKSIRITTADRDDVTLLIGNSYSSRDSYVRIESEPDVFVTTIESWEISPDPNRWIDKSVLMLAAKEVRGFTIGSVEYEKVQEKFVTVNERSNSDEQKVDIETLVNAVLNMQVSGFYDSSPNPALERLLVKVNLLNGGILEYSISKIPNENDEYMLKRSDYQTIYKIPANRLEAILALIKDKKK